MTNDDALDRLTRRLGELGDQGISGTVLAARDGDTIFQHCLGLADRAGGVPVEPKTRFQTASVTKLFTAVAVLDQVAHGRFALTTPIVDLVPADRRPSTLAAEVTVHHLLSHTSGIADYFEEDESLPDGGGDYADLWRTIPPARLERPIDFLALYGDRPAYGPPGGEWHYNNAGYVLLAEVLEQVTGKPITEVITERVLARAGATDSGFDRTDDPQPYAAVHYRPSGRTNVHAVPVIGGGDGGCVCTAADLVRVTRAVADRTLLGEHTELMLTRHSDLGSGWGFGYGVMLFPDGRFGHTGGDPGVSAVVNHWPDTGVTIAALCNVEETDDLDPAIALCDAVLAELDQLSPRPER